MDDELIADNLSIFHYKLRLTYTFEIKEGKYYASCEDFPDIIFTGEDTNDLQEDFYSKFCKFVYSYLAVYHNEWSLGWTKTDLKLSPFTLSISPVRSYKGKESELIIRKE